MVQNLHICHNMVQLLSFRIKADGTTCQRDGTFHFGVKCLKAIDVTLGTHGTWYFRRI